jgi:hypothetical protein
MTDLETELLAMNRRLSVVNSSLSHAMQEILRVLARDTVTVCDLATPADELEVVMLRGVRQRAARILEGLGGHHVEH